MKRQYGIRLYILDILRRVCTQCQRLSGKRTACMECTSEHGVVEPK